MSKAFPVALFVLGTLVPAARADDHFTQFVPEINIFAKLSERVRLYLYGNLAKNFSHDIVDGELGAHLDYFFAPEMWVRAGYVRTGIADGWGNGYSEDRIVMEATARKALPGEFWLVNRGRVDFRDVEGQTSRRYRLRLGIERGFTAGGVPLVPYAQAEVFYDTRFNSWNRQLYQTGVEIELAKSWRLEPYVSRQNDQSVHSANVDAFGLVLKWYY